MSYILLTPLSHLVVWLTKRVSGFNTIDCIHVEDEQCTFPIVKGETCEETKVGCSTEELLCSDANKPFATISDYHLAYKGKRATPLEVITRLIEICKSSEISALNALVENNESEMMDAARKSTERYESGEQLSIVDGVPFFVKEELQIDGYVMRLGFTHFSLDCNTTATVVARLLENGAIFCGYTTMVQLGSNPVGFNPSPVRPSCRNPWNTDCYCGGSSSGSACLVAAGLCPFAIGVDGLGSVRIPPAMTGQVGLKSTFSRVSSFGHLRSDDSPFICVGPIACCVRDAAIVYSLIAGPDLNYKLGLDQPSVLTPSLRCENLRGVKFGVCKEYVSNSSPSVLKLFDNACEKIKSDGGIIVEVEIPLLSEFFISSIVSVSGLWKTSQSDTDITNAVTKSEDVNLSFISTFGKATSQTTIENSHRLRSRLIKTCKDLFGMVDILLTPTTACTALSIQTGDHSRGFFDENSLRSHTVFCFFASFAGLPALVLNMGYEEKSGLPSSIQLMSKWWDEHELLSIGNRLESVFVKTITPPLFKSPLKL